MTMLMGAAAVGSLRGQASDTTLIPGQAPACAALTGSPYAVCQAAHDAVFATLPAWSLLIGGGNPSLGTAAAVGKLGRIALTLRLNHALVILPSTDYDGTTDTVRGVRRKSATLPSVDMAFGLIQKTLPAGTVGVDFLSSIFLQRPGGTPFLTSPEDTRRLAGLAVGFGWGIRIGLSPTGPMPFASLSITKRDLPRFTYGILSSGSTYAYTMGISAINIRLLAGRRFGGFEVTAGAGVDMLKGAYSLVFTDPETGTLQPQVDSTRSAMRIITTVNAAFDLKPVRLTFEGGYQVGKDEKLPTIVKSVNPHSGRFFGGLGLGVRF
ncbi:MAG: hypothetical protein HOP28_18570 [Gemmatimonadales bacterium]|nr:hypothetical protein [Gemmatimonadales bacterium]